MPQLPFQLDLDACRLALVILAQYHYHDQGVNAGGAGGGWDTWRPSTDLVSHKVGRDGRCVRVGEGFLSIAPIPPPPPPPPAHPLTPLTLLNPLTPPFPGARAG